MQFSRNDSGSILIVDDDREIRELLADFLAKHGYAVHGVADGAAMRAALSAIEIDLIVLDIMLPDSDGLSLCKEVRSSSAVPVIMLTAIGDEVDRIIGLEVGADDYVAKPFNPRELLARVRAVLRRTSSRISPEQERNRITFAGWTLDLVKRELTSPKGAIVELTTGEYDLLLTFVERPQRVLSRDQLLDFTRGRTAMPFDRTIDVQVSRLRRKFENESDGENLIKTIRGAGYMMIARIERSS